MAKPTNEKPNPYRPNIWGFLSNVFQTAINKGQIIPLGIVIFCIIFISRIPYSSLKHIGDKIIEAFESWHLLGWGITLIESVIGVLIFKRQSKKYNEEIDRLIKEKEKLQDEILSRQSF